MRGCRREDIECCARKRNYPDSIVIIRGGVFNAIKCSLWGYYERQDVDGFNGISLRKVSEALLVLLPLLLLLPP